MGATFESATIAATSEKDAVRLAHDIQEQALYDGGHDPYSGHLGTCGVGVKVLKLEFATCAVALSYIEEEHAKWDRPMLAHVTGTDDWVLGGWCPC